MITLNFTKMHGIGNDFVVIDARAIQEEYNWKEVAQKVSDRHFGVGADGLILILNSEKADYRMRILNSDGSEAEMCGNGIRCFAKYLSEKDNLTQDSLTIETLAGIITPRLIREKGVVDSIEVDMGEPELTSFRIPTTLNTPDNRVINHPIQADGLNFEMTCVSMGNPHCVIFVDDISKIELEKIGPSIEKMETFPNRTNVEFVEKVASDHLKVRVWERGSGETLACGTGACATVVAGVLTGRCERETIISLPGGYLEINYRESDNHVLMAGTAEIVFEGKSTLV